MLQGISTLVLESPYYGKRRPPNQQGSRLLRVSDLLVLGRSTIEESLCLLEWASQPFHPDHLRDNGSAADVGERVAHALEYIAAQLGEISRKMDFIGSGFTATKEDFEGMTELLKKL